MIDSAIPTRLMPPRATSQLSTTDSQLMMRVVRVGMFFFPLLAITLPERDSPISIGSIDAIGLMKLGTLLTVLVFGSLILIQQWLQAQTLTTQRLVREEPALFAILRAFFPYFLFLGWAILSVTWSARMSISLGQSGGVTSLLIISCLVALIATRQGGIEIVLKNLCYALLLLSVLLLIIHVVFPGLSGLDRRMLIAGADGLVHPTAASANASLGLLIAVACTFLQKYKWSKQMLMASVCIHGTVLVLASSRSAWGMTLVTIPLCLFLTGDNIRRAWLGLAGAATILFQLIADPGFHSLTKDSNIGVSYMMRGQSLMQLKALSGREEMWTKVWNEYLKSPFTGHGYFLTSAAGEMEVWEMLANHTAHNIYLQVLSGTGLIGLILFSIAIASLLFRFTKLQNADQTSKNLFWLLFLVMVWFAGWSLFSASFMGPVRSESVVFYTMLGLGVGQGIRLGPRALLPGTSSQVPTRNQRSPENKSRGWITAQRIPSWVNKKKLRSAMAMLDQLIVSGTSFVTIVIVERACGSEGLGLFSLAISVVIFSRGVQQSLISTPYTVLRSRVTERMNPRSYAGASLLTTLLYSSVLLTALTFIAIGFSSTELDPKIRSIVWVLVITVPCAILCEFSRRFDMAGLNMSSAVTFDSGVSLIQLASLVALASMGELTTSLALLIIGISQLLMVCGWMVTHRNSFQFPYGTLRESIKNDWKLGRWLLIDQLVCFVQLYGMPWLLTLMIAPSATGIFAACASIAALAGPFLAGIGNYLSPQFAETVSSGNRSETSLLFWKTTTLLSIFVGSFAFGAMLFSSELLQLIYNNPDYQNYTLVVVILAMRMLFGIPAIGSHHGLIALEYPRGSLHATIVGTVVTLTCAIPLIWVFGILGAAIALIVGTACETIFLVLVFRARFKSWNWKNAD